MLVDIYSFMKDVVRRMHVDQLGKTFGDAFYRNGDVICLMKRNVTSSRNGGIYQQ